jgi:hypothetical protein
MFASKLLLARGWKYKLKIEEMKRILLLAILMSTIQVFAQEEDLNAAEKMIQQSDSKLRISGYANIDYNQPISKEVRKNGKLDIHRLVMLFGYQFNDRTSFVTEIEYEHVKEVYVEQAFLNYRISKQLNFRAGLLLVPMGIVNEFHEPTTYNGVERPNLDKYIIPSTWREIGAGFTGRFDDLSIKYQAYIMNGFNGYNGEGVFRGSDGLRKGRQKGAESFMSSPTFAGKIDYYGLKGLRFGVSAYSGKSQSKMFDGLDMNNSALVDQADSTRIGINMIGLDGRYTYKGFHLRGQYTVANLSNTDQYNTFTGKDLGSQLAGYYIELSYDILNTLKTKHQLIPFVRYESYDTHNKVEGIEKNDTYARTEIITGLGWKPVRGAMLKADYQWVKTNASEEFDGILNLGVGIWF